MDVAFGFSIASVVIVLWAILFGFTIRNRIKIGNWLHAPDYFNVQIPDRKTALARHIVKTQWNIDDSRTELSLIELEEKKKEDEKK